ncbi:uncharacterized protein LOC130050081 [Ostrea edulis]|uniref:uncharacterized protein LOC130050081 n=1 Tax=Ostrea edulis TaxID=37623 RepID=UPI0024AF8B32|nr:uncharacterized protein LOC130050081 [Ostrea edulis]
MIDNFAHLFCRMDIRHYNCVLCGGRPTSSQRRPASSFRHILSRHFSVNAVETDVLCNKCRHKCRNTLRRKHIPIVIPSDKDESMDPTFTSPKKSKSIPISSPPSISLPLPSSSKSHAYCFVCKNPGPKLLSVSHQARIFAFVQKEIIIPQGARCCAGHLDNGKLSNDALQNTKTNDGVLLNRASVLTIIQSLREMAAEHPRLDFDDENSMDDDDYKVLIRFSRMEFQDIISSITSINSSKNRTKRTCVAILLIKLRSALSNKMLAVLFKMSKYQIRRAIKSARTALMTDFVPHNLGFQHISREDVIQ